ncbi:MAG: hypothetical protein OIF50_13070 [Flavobacteriaceae bacterium]|nr:hypothetical protein [Flavobacteriaceae bacterium]
MKSLLSYSNALRNSRLLLLLLLGMHLGILVLTYADVGNLGAYFWGGRGTDTSTFLLLEWVSLVLVVLFYALLRLRAHSNVLWLRVFLFVVGLYFALNTLGNLLAVSWLERGFALLTIYLSACFFRLSSASS